MFKTFLTVFSLSWQATIYTRLPTDHHIASHHRTSDTPARSELLPRFKTAYFVWLYDSTSKFIIIFQQNSL